MPRTLAALERGMLSEWRATLTVRESACLDVEEWRALDAELCGDPSGLEGMGDARVAAAAKAIAYRLDPHAVVERAAKAETERTVIIRPAPDTGCMPIRDPGRWWPSSHERAGFRAGWPRSSLRDQRCRTPIATPYPAQRPRHTAPPRRTNLGGPRAGHVRTLQLRQRSRRLAGQHEHRRNRKAHSRIHHSHRQTLPICRTPARTTITISELEARVGITLARHAA